MSKKGLMLSENTIIEDEEGVELENSEDSKKKG